MGGAADEPAAAIIAVDVGGTFTDVALWTLDGLARAKVLSTPPRYEEGILEGLRAVLGSDDLMGVVVHGTTVATNAVLSGEGLGRVALVTTAGFRDVLEIARMKHADVHDINWDKPTPIIPRNRVFELEERMGPDGSVITPLDENALAHLVDAVQKLDVEAVAVAFLNSYVNPAHEAEVRRALLECNAAPQVTLGTDLSRAAGEYERTSTAALNASLLPLMSKYLSGLAGSLSRDGQENAFYVMQSNGGLVPGEIAASVPVALLESGPAASVLGASFVARSLGIRHAIAFDMGGTTAKAGVLLNGDAFEAPDFEVGGEINNTNFLTRGSGYAVQLPCFDLSEVGAGGGSLAYVDEDGELHVGPKSAGADPGPACYGLGGDRPTVTDANLVLGYLAEGRLDSGITLDASAARRVIEEWIAKPLGIAVEDAAHGIRAVANSAMSRALRSVTVERGLDPSIHELIVSGGAGPAHAVDLGSDLGVRRVIVPPCAGVLSAVGMLSAPLRRDRALTVDLRLTGLDADRLRTELNRLADELRHEFKSAGLAAAAVEYRAILDMRYEGQTSRLPVVLPSLGAVSEGEIQVLFEGQHRERYGYVSSDERLEIATIRMTATLAGPARGLSLMAPAKGAASPHATTQRMVYFGPGVGWVETPVVRDRAQIRECPTVGPVVIEEIDTTTVVPPEYPVTLDDGGALVIDVSAGPERTRSVNIAMQHLEVLRHRLEATADEMAMTVYNTSRSLIVQTFDFSVAIGTASGELAARGVGPELHIATLPTAIAAIHETFGGRFRPGDVFCLNDPYQGGTHLPDIILVEPIHDHDRLLAYSFSLAHHADLGGATAGMATGARDLFGEGVIVPPVRLVREGQIDEDLWRMIVRNSRTPVEVAGDLQAQLAALRVAKGRIAETIEALGSEHFVERMDALLDHTERLTRAEIRRLPRGRYSAVDYVDSDGVSGNSITLRVELEIGDGHVVVDFSGCSDQIANGLNCNPSVVAAAVSRMFRTLFQTAIPENGGFARCFDIRTRRGSVTDPMFPAPVASRSLVGLRLNDLLATVLAEVAPGRMWAPGDGGVTIVSIVGTSDDQRPYALTDILTAGSGARPTKDGVEGSSISWNTPIEQIEHRYPIRIGRYGYAPGTGGKGQFRGTNAVIREWELVGEPAVVFWRTDRRAHQPPGLQGGEKGAPSRAEFRARGTESWEMLPQIGTRRFNAGDRLRLQTAGGGGYGDAKDRPPHLLEKDRREGRD